MVGVANDFINTVTLTKPSVGSWKFFLIENTCNLVCFTTTNPDKFDSNNQVAFIESTQLCNFLQSCAGNVCTLKIKSTSAWMLGIIQNLFSLKETPFASIFCWCGKNSSHGVSSFATVSHNHWRGTQTDFSLKKIIEWNWTFVCESNLGSFDLPWIYLSNNKQFSWQWFTVFKKWTWYYSPSIPKSWSNGSNKSLSLKSVPIKNPFGWNFAYYLWQEFFKKVQVNSLDIQPWQSGPYICPKMDATTKIDK